MWVTPPGGQDLATKMPVSCSLYGCTNCFGERQGLGFCRIPAAPEAKGRTGSRQDCVPLKRLRVCHNRFLTGKLATKLRLDHVHCS